MLRGGPVVLYAAVCDFSARPHTLAHCPPTLPTASAASRSSRDSSTVLNQCTLPSFARRRYLNVDRRFSSTA